MATQNATKEWKKVRIDECFDIQQGKQVSKSNRRGDNQHPFLRTANVFWGELDLATLDQMHFTEAEEERLALRKGDLLVCEGGDVGRTAMWHEEKERCYYQNHLHRLRKNTKEIDGNFALLYLQYAFVYAKLYFGRANVTTIPNLSKSRLSELEIALPSLSEQQTIAQILTTIQDAIAEQEKLIAKLKELKRSMMQHLFTHGTKDEKTKITDIGEVPGSWEVVELGSIFKFSSGKSRPKDTTKVRAEVNKYPVYGGNGVLGYSSEALFEERKLIIGRVGEYCGCVHLTEDHSWISDNALYAKDILADANLDFFKYLLGHWNLNRYSNKMGQPLVTQGILSKVQIPYAAKAEQDRIAAALSRIDQKIDEVSRKLFIYQNLFKTLLHEMMSGERRINI